MDDEAILESLVDMIAEGTMKAASLHMHRFPKVAGLDRDRQADLVTGALRQILKQDIAVILDRVRESVDVCLPEPWLKHILNVECNSTAVKALGMVEEEL